MCGKYNLIERPVNKRFVTCLAIAFFGVSCAYSQESTLVSDTNSEIEPKGEVLKAKASDVSTMEELVTSEVREEVLNAFTINDFHRINNLGSYYFRTKRYDKAFPYLLASAKRGFKGAQYDLGVIYVNGWGGIDKDVALGIGWIGVAASPRSTTSMKETYKDLMDQVPKRLKPKVQEIVDALTERYGSEATGVECMDTRVAGTHLRSFECNFEKEFEFRDAFYQDWLSTSFQGASPYVTGFESSDPSGQSSPNAGVGGSTE